MTLDLKAEKRVKIGKTKNLGNSGLLAAVCYGKGTDSTPIQISLSEFKKIWREAGESTVVNLNIDSKPTDCLIHQVDFDPVTGEPLHVDFYVFEKGHKIEVDIPIEFIGTSPAAKELGGVLVKVMRELKIEADPSSLPKKIEVDISPLAEIDSHICVKDIILPSGVVAVNDADEVVVAVTAQQEEKEEAPVDLSQIEVEKKGKKDEETAPESN